MIKIKSYACVLLLTYRTKTFIKETKSKTKIFCCEQIKLKYVLIIISVRGQIVLKFTIKTKGNNPIVWLLFLFKIILSPLTTRYKLTG